MTDIHEVLVNIRKNFSFLWDDFGFRLTELKPRDQYRDSGYHARLENGWSQLLFYSEIGYLDDIHLGTKSKSVYSIRLKRLVFLTTKNKWKREYDVGNAENVFRSYAEYFRPYLVEMLELAKTPDSFKARIEELEAVDQSESLTIEMIRAERARLHSLGLDSSLANAMANLREGGKHE